ncbi:MAG: hypothetical protein LBR37_04235 [Erysipelotrichaceae bacterium]|jgi:predicted transport protein|nr:hypothetical protein [Erysipelotrichaceae bacterium]
MKSEKTKHGSKVFGSGIITIILVLIYVILGIALVATHTSYQPNVLVPHVYDSISHISHFFAQIPLVFDFGGRTNVGQFGAEMHIVWDIIIIGVLVLGIILLVLWIISLVKGKTHTWKLIPLYILVFLFVLIALVNYEMIGLDIAGSGDQVLRIMQLILLAIIIISMAFLTIHVFIDEPVEEEKKIESDTGCLCHVCTVPDCKCRDGQCSSTDETTVTTTTTTKTNEDSLVKHYGTTVNNTDVEEEEVVTEVVETAAAPHAVIMRVPFLVRLYDLSDRRLQDIYTEIKNEILSYDGIKSRISKSGDTFRAHTKAYVKIVVAGKALKLYMALSPDDYDESTIPVGDAGNKKLYKDIPLVFKVKSKLSIKRAKELIANVMDTDLVPQGEVLDIDWISESRPIADEQRRVFRKKYQLD